ncbi:MAG: ankyrin repeat domain-containing protein [Lysobacterales bacterium]|nr:ankyrin repeat domain-containing protein [Xanthomonadales bacterium]
MALSEPGALACRALVLLALCSLLCACQLPASRGDITAQPRVDIGVAIGEAVRTGNCAALPQLLPTTVPAQQRDELTIPLLRSAYQGLTACVRHLVEAGADVDAPLADGSTALALAARQGHIDVLAYLLDQGAQVNLANRAGVAALALAADQEDGSALALLLRSGANIDAASVRGWTALHHAVASCRIGPVSQLLAAGARVDARDRNGNTPLLLAAAACAPAVAPLLDRGAEIDAVETQGMTALMVAAQNRQTQTMALLLARGADSSRRDRSGRDFSSWAAR